MENKGYENLERAIEEFAMFDKADQTPRSPEQVAELKAAIKNLSKLMTGKDSSAENGEE